MGRPTVRELPPPHAFVVVGDRKMVFDHECLKCHEVTHVTTRGRVGVHGSRKNKYRCSNGGKPVVK